jgi:hypothetical protein
MSLQFLKEDCYQTHHLHCFCIEFYPDAQRRRGFHASQLIDYSLEPNPDAEEDKEAPPQMFTLAFSTADVIIVGWRLDRLADRLAQNELAAVGVLPKRYAEFDRQKPFVASIQIKPVGRE